MEVVRNWPSKSEFMVSFPQRELRITGTISVVTIFYVPSTCILDLSSVELLLVTQNITMNYFENFTDSRI